MTAHGTPGGLWDAFRRYYSRVLLENNTLRITASFCGISLFHIYPFPPPPSKLSRSFAKRGTGQVFGISSISCIKVNSNKLWYLVADSTEGEKEGGRAMVLGTGGVIGSRQVK